MPPALDPERPDAPLAARRLLAGGADARLDELTDLAARILGVACADVSLLVDDRTLIGAARAPGTHTERPLAESVLATTVRTGRPEVVNDARADARLAALHAVTTGVVGAFISVPLRTPRGELVGALSAYDSGPREWRDTDADDLAAVAVAVGAELELAAVTRELDRGRARWDPAVAAAGIGCFDWDVRTGQLYWDDVTIALFGYTDEDRFDNTIEGFNLRLHPDDLPRVTHARQVAIDNLGVYEIDYRVVLPTGQSRRLQSRGMVYGDSRGRAVRLLGVVWDITLAHGEDQKATGIIESMPVGYLTVDEDWTIVSLNVAGEQLLHARRWELVGRPLWDALPEAVGTDFERLYRRVFATHVSETFEAFYPAPVSRWMEMRVVSNKPGLAMYMTDVSDRRAAQEAAAAIAAHDRSTAIALQEAMLTKLPQPDHLEIRARYITAAAEHQVGGDWYDAIVEANGSTIAIVGDVGGHDIGAATVMGQLRSMLRAFAWADGQSPAGALRRLDHAMRDLRFTTLATCIAARIEQPPELAGTDQHLVRWSNAGNMPMLAVEPGGAVQLLERSPDLMLGIEPTGERHDHTVNLPPGSTILMYTDGLVESRGSDIDDRLGQLVTVAGGLADRSVDDLLDELVAAMVGARPEDDVVVLALRMHPHHRPEPT